MPLSGYPFEYKGIGRHNEGPLLKEHIFTFKNSINLSYIVNVEEYENDVFVLKFHLKSHKLSKRKYSLQLCKCNLIGDNKYHYIQARKVLFTCINIGLQLYSANPCASFGFIGMPTIQDGEIEKLAETKRYRVYEKLAIFYFDRKNFEHRRSKDKSIYLLLNRKKLAQSSRIFDEIKKMFLTAYNIDDIYADLIKDMET